MMAQRPVDESSWAEAAMDGRKTMGGRDFQLVCRVRSQLLARGLLVLTGLLVALYPEQALAKARHKARRPAGEDKRVCVESYYKAKESIQSGHLIEAKEPLGKCARAVCGSFLKQECTKLYLLMDADVPSVVPMVVDAAAGVAGSAFEVRMDGELLTSKLDGLPIPVNPGWHEFTFSTEDRIFATEKILISQGQRNRAVSVSQRPPERKVADVTDVIPTRATHRTQVALEETDSESEKVDATPLKGKAVQEGQSKTGASWVAYALGGVGLVGLGGAGLFTYWGRQDNSALRSSCSPDCNPASVHHIRMMYLAADVSGATGVVTLFASTLLFLHSRSTQEKVSNQMARLRIVDVRPTASGAYATVGGTF